MPQPDPGSQSRQRSAGGGPEAGPSTARQSADISDVGAQGTGASVYSKNRYKQDCALLLLIHHERERHADLAGLISKNDLSAAMGVYRLESARGKSELQAKAQTDLNGPDNLGSNLRNFKPWLERFRRGPTSTEDEHSTHNLIQFDIEVAQEVPPPRNSPALTLEDAQELVRRVRRLEQASNRTTPAPFPLAPAPEYLMWGALREENPVPPAPRAFSQRSPLEPTQGPSMANPSRREMVETSTYQTDRENRLRPRAYRDRWKGAPRNRQNIT